jgi:hypothetical protein
VVFENEIKTVCRETIVVVKAITIRKGNYNRREGNYYTDMS